jgi:hypothetical protein
MHDMLLLRVFFAVLQVVFARDFSLNDYIDFTAGPILLIASAKILTDERLSVSALKRIRRRTLFWFALPISIALLQYVGILPLEFLNATYVNATLYGSEQVNRVNGYLYHGIELAVVIFFFFTSIAIGSSTIRAYVALTAMVLMEFVILIKTGILTAFAMMGYFAYFIDRRVRSLKSILIAIGILLGFSYLYILIPDIQEDRFSFDFRDFKFKDQLFTGRGYIWNIYIGGIRREFSAFNYLFGGGFGSATPLFLNNAPPSGGQSQPAYGPHNQILELFINGGLFAIWLISYIIWKQYKRLSAYFEQDKSVFKQYFVAVIFIPLLIMGLTAPIMNNFIYWCGLVLVLISLKIKFYQSEDIQAS